MVYLDCPDALYGRHGPTDSYGKCPWCGKKVESVALKPRADRNVKSDALASYDYYYDPDYGIDPYDRY